MSTIKNVELIDDVRNDALILMRENSNISYEEAFEKAKVNLIGDEKISEFKFQPFEVEIDEDLLKNSLNNEKSASSEQPSEQIELTDEQKEDLEVLEKLDGLDTDFYENIRNQLKDIINVSEFNDDQLEQLYIGSRMGVDITKIANNKFQPAQIKFLCVMMASGKNIDVYTTDYNFDPEQAFVEIAQQEMEEM